MSIRPVDKFIQAKDRVMVTRMGNITELQYMEKCNREAKIRKIDKYTYEVIKTGEIREFDLSETRKDNVNSLRQTFKKLAYLINNNFSGRKNEFWLTLTYAEKEYDVNQVSVDYDRFLKRLKYQTRDLGELGAICVKEPHADGSWHIHMLLKYPNRKKAYIANDRLREIWGHGFVKINHIKRTDNLGAYLCAYLTDISLDEAGVCYGVDDCENIDLFDMEQQEELDYLYGTVLKQEGVEGISLTKTDKSKAVVKGGRLAYYPVDMKIYHATRNMTYPERFEMEYDYAKEQFGLEDENLTIRRSLKIEDDENEFENTIVIEQYNKKVNNPMSFLAELKMYKKEMQQYLSGKLAEDWKFSFLKGKIYELENKFELLRLNREFFKNGAV